MAKKEKAVSEPTQFGSYILVNREKLDRVINGIAGTDYSGLGQDAPEEAILAEYDRMGGLVLLKDGDTEVDEDGEEVKVNVKLATGSFYDFKLRAPRKEPLVKRVKKSSGGRVTSELVGDEDVDKPKRKPKSPADEKE